MIWTMYTSEPLVWDHQANRVNEPGASGNGRLEGEGKEAASETPSHPTADLRDRGDLPAC